MSFGDPRIPLIALLATGEVTDLSLDHDLGDDARGTGYDVILWIEHVVATSALKGFKVGIWGRG